WLAELQRLGEAGEEGDRGEGTVCADDQRQGVPQAQLALEQVQAAAGDAAERATGMKPRDAGAGGEVGEPEALVEPEGDLVGEPRGQSLVAAARRRPLRPGRESQAERLGGDERGRAAARPRREG